ncbi:MAG: agmatine deiminase family protein [Planctomycetes bacterium]|nr:agmatine deiminase family protein [Planctomycetota bacterium]
MDSNMTQTAAELGYRMPGEFEPLDAVWLARPRNEETWPGCFDEALAQHDAFAAAMRKVIRVDRIGEDHDWPVNDSWIRDYGPLFVVNASGGLAAHDFVFNGWGGKYNNEYADDDIAPQRIAPLLNIPLFKHTMVLEGGSIDVNGRGTVMTTAQCLLNKNRNPHMTRREIEAELHAALGTRHTIWLPGGIVGDDTDGHIDDIARFVDPVTILASRAPEGHDDYAMLAENFDALLQARDQDGDKLNIIALPVPDPIMYDFPPDRFGPGGVNPVPASYANFLIVNDHVFTPIFGQSRDDEALKIIEKTTGKTAIGIRSEYLVVGLGALHCLSMQQPAPRRAGH